MSNRGSPSRNSMRLSHRTSGTVGPAVFLPGTQGPPRAAAGPAGVEGALVPADARSIDPVHTISSGGPLNATSPFLKNGVSASATSPGVWNRRAGSLAIILATRAASSAGTSGRIEIQRAGVPGDVGLVDVVKRIRLERRAAGQEVVERAAKAVDVGPDIGTRGVEDLLGGDEVGRAEGLPFARSSAPSTFSSRVALARPKSSTLTVALSPLRASIRLPGLMSRWTSPSSWACWRPRAA